MATVTYFAVMIQAGYLHYLSGLHVCTKLW